MVPETRFSDKEKSALEKIQLTLEMSNVNEWIAREEDQPNNLLIIFVAPTDKANELQAACSCAQGTADLPCVHALAVFQAIRQQNGILIELFKRRSSHHQVLIEPFRDRPPAA